MVDLLVYTNHRMGDMYYNTYPSLAFVLCAGLCSRIQLQPITLHGGLTYHVRVDTWKIHILFC